MCSVCASNYSPHGATQSHRSNNATFGEQFTFINERAKLCSKTGFKAYNESGLNVGIVFMTDDKSTSSYGFAELCFFEKYHNAYRQWHRIKSHGGRIAWDVLCDRIDKYGKYECYID